MIFTIIFHKKKCLKIIRAKYISRCPGSVTQFKGVKKIVLILLSMTFNSSDSLFILKTREIPLFSILLSVTSFQTQ